MLRVAIIDSSFNGDPAASIDKYYELNKGHICQSVLPEVDQKSCHGTTCAKIYSKYASDNYLIAVKIFDDVNEYITSLLIALDWCLDQNIDIILLSIGTRNYFDKDALGEVIDNLTEKGTIIIAAMNNNNSITYPASLPNVIGVSCDRTETLGAGELICVDEDIRGLNFVVGSIKTVSEFYKERLGNSNSFVVPYVGALVTGIQLQHRHTLEQVSKQLKEKCIEVGNLSDIQNYFPLFYEPDTIVVKVMGDYVNSQILLNMALAFQCNDYNVILITSSRICRISDFPASRIYIQDDLNEIDYIIKATNPDIAIIYSELDPAVDCIIEITDQTKDCSTIDEDYEEINEVSDFQAFGNIGITVIGDPSEVDMDDVFFAGDISDVQKELILEKMKERGNYKTSDVHDKKVEHIVVHPDKIETGEIVAILESVFV